MFGGPCTKTGGYLGLHNNTPYSLVVDPYYNRKHIPHTSHTLRATRETGIQNRLSKNVFAKFGVP